MKRSALFLLLLVRFVLPVRGDDAHIARFDVARVFEQYQLTKDLQHEADAARNQTGPQTDPIRRDQALREKLQRRIAELSAGSKDATLRQPKGMHFQPEEETVTAILRLDDVRRALMSTATDPGSAVEHDMLQRQIDNLEVRIRQAPLGSPEQERLRLEIQIPIDRLRINEARSSMESIERELSLWNEVRERRARILNDIWAMAAKLRAERGFTLLVPVNGPDEDQFLTVIVPADCEDVTDALLRRLNEEYAAKKTP